MTYGVLNSGPMPPCTGTYQGTPGIRFIPSGNVPATGTFVYGQLIISDTTTYSHNSGGSMVCTHNAGVDNHFPYQGVDQYDQAGDAPFAPLPSSYDTVSRSFNATMYLLWQPSLSNSIPIPLGYQSWQFSNSTTQSNGSWQTPTSSGGPQGIFTLTSVDQASLGYPT